MKLNKLHNVFIRHARPDGLDREFSALVDHCLRGTEGELDYELRRLASIYGGMARIADKAAELAGRGSE